MATFPSSSSIVLLFLAQLLSLSRQTIGQDARLLGLVCSQTRDPNLCSSYLGEVPYTLTAPLEQLGQIVIDQAEYKAGQTKISITTYVFGVNRTDPKLYELASRCESLYWDALDSLLRLPGLLKSHKYLDVSNEADTIRNKVNACEAAFGYQSPFKADNQVVEILADAIFVISKRLATVNEL